MNKMSTRKALEKEIEKLHPIYIRQRDGHKCVVCGSAQKPTCGHIFSRRSRATRWDISEDGNCHCQCWPCNFRHGGYGGGPRRSWPYFRWYINKFGIERLDSLEARSNTVKQHTLDELEELAKFLREHVVSNN